MVGLIIREAVAGDHGALERLFLETSMAGAIRIGSDRSPDFFATSRVQASEPCVWGAFTGEGRAVGVFSMGRRIVWLGGEKKPLRYLSDLRIHPDWRNGTMLAKGFRVIKEQVFAEGEWAQTLVLEQNLPALDFLRSGRGGLPEYREAGRYKNWLLPFQKLSRPTYRVRKARPEDLPAIQSRLDESSQRRSFSPVIDLTKLGEPYLNGLSVDDCLVAEESGEILGVMALWNQSAYQRLRVDGYSAPLAFSRAIINFHARLRGGVPLPAAGKIIPIVKATAIACAGDDPAILRSLLGVATSMEKGRYLSIGLSEKDPLAAALAGMRGKIFTGLHFLVGWEGKPPDWLEPFAFDTARI